MSLADILKKERLILMSLVDLLIGLILGVGSIIIIFPIIRDFMNGR